MNTMKAKNFIVVGLLVFVGLSIAFIFLNERKKADAVPVRMSETPVTMVYYFHGNTRCKTCLNIEAYTKETVENRFVGARIEDKVRFISVNVEEPENEHFVKDYQLTTRSVVLSRQDKGKEISWKRLDEVWNLVKDKPAFMRFVHQETADMMKRSD